MKIEYIKVKGSDYQLGYQQGVNLKNSINKAWNALLDSPEFETVKPKFVPKNVIVFVGKLLSAWISKPTLSGFKFFRERVKGISDGSGIDIGKLLFMYFVELAGSDSARALMGCSSIAVIPPKSDEPILAKNFDFINSFRPFNIMRASIPDNGFSSLEFTFAPSAGSHTGMNEKGLALTYNYGFSMIRFAKAPLISAKIQYILQNCSSVDEAKNVLRNSKNSSSGIITIVDSDGKAVSVEVNPKESAVVTPFNGILVNANLFYAKSTRKYMVPFDAVYGEKAPESLRGKNIQYTNVARTRRLFYLINRHEKINVEILKTILADHGQENSPSGNTICRHHESFGTHLSIIMLPKRRILHYLFGHPCEGKWMTTKI